jgi:hypothetical protein
LAHVRVHVAPLQFTWHEPEHTTLQLFAFVQSMLAPLPALTMHTLLLAQSYVQPSLHCIVHVPPAPASPAVVAQVAVQLSRHCTLQSPTLVHATLHPGAVPHFTSQLAPLVHAQLDPLQLHVAPVHVGEAVGPHAKATRRPSTQTMRARHIASRIAREGVNVARRDA